MHSFNDLDLKTLKKICSKYNLHMKIAKYSKLNKEQLIPHMEKHLHISTDGKIRLSENAVDDAEDELDKLIDELKNKVKEVKEKVIKHYAKKAKKEIQIDEKKEKKTVEEMKEEEILKAIPLYLKLDDYKNNVEVNQKMQEMVEPMDHFPSVADALQGIEAYLKKHPELNKQKKEKKEKKEENYFEKMENEKYKKERKEYHEYRIKKIDENIKFYSNNDYKYWKKEKPEVKKQFIQEAIYYGYEDEIKKYPILQKYYEKVKNDGLLFSKKYEDKPEKEIQIEEKTPIDKIDKIQNELNKLEQLIKIDEKQNEKEHKQLKKEIKESESDEEYNAMKPKKASDVLILKVSEAKDLAKIHNISLKHKVNNKEVAKGGPMLKKEIIKYLKL